MYAVGLALAGRRPTFPKRHTTGFDIYFPPPPEDDWGHSHRQEGRVCASRGMSYRRMENRVSRREGRAGEIGQQARSGSGQHEGRVSRTDGTGQQEGRDGSAGREVVSGRDGAGQLDTRDRPAGREGSAGGGAARAGGGTHPGRHRRRTHRASQHQRPEWRDETRADDGTQGSVVALNKKNGEAFRCVPSRCRARELCYEVRMQRADPFASKRKVWSGRGVVGP